MIARLTLFTLKPGVSPERLEEIMCITRTTLLKIPEVLALRTGKRIHPGDPWDWFVFLEVESLDKLAICHDDPHHFKYLQEVVHTSVSHQQELSFEMEPRKNVKYS